MTRRNFLQFTICFLCTAIIIASFAAIFFFAKNQIMRRLYPLQYSEFVEPCAQEYSLDKYLIYAIIKTESSFNPQAESYAAARGLMQITEDTFDWIKSKIDPNSELTFDDMYVPKHNISFGTFLVSYCLDRYGGDVSTAAGAYHSGVGAMDRLLENTEFTSDGIKLDVFPNDVLAHYVKKINNNYNSYLDLYTGR